MLETYLLLESIAKKYEEIVLETKIFKLTSGEASKLRIELVDESFADVWISVSGNYSYHWNRLEIDGTIYRYDNAPHKVWEYVATYPHHFHKGDDKTVIESDMDLKPDIQMKKFMDFVRETLLESI